MKELMKREHEDRLEALNNAVRHRLTSETPENIVQAAGKYLQFLQGGEETADK